MGSVYSTLFLRQAWSSGYQSVSYTVPAGQVAIVRDVTALIGGGTGSNCEVYLTDPVCYIAFANGAASGDVVLNWQGRVVVPSGVEMIGDGIAEGACSLLVSGYLLNG